MKTHNNTHKHVEKRGKLRTKRAKTRKFLRKTRKNVENCVLHKTR